MKKSFTLIELLIVLFIISLLISIVAPKGFHMIKSIERNLAKKKQKEKINQIKYKSYLQCSSNKKYGINKYGIKK
jgi:prepilin-type N-terminal cleavage/methylation domain-containing protein